MTWRSAVRVVPLIACLALAWTGCGHDSAPREPEVLLENSFEANGEMVRIGNPNRLKNPTEPGP